MGTIAHLKWKLLYKCQKHIILDLRWKCVNGLLQLTCQHLQTFLIQ